MEEDSLYDNDAGQDQRKLFDKTLTNMRLAFGSEKHIRENSVKTLEKIEGEDSGSGNKTEEKSSIFEKKSFQEFSLKKFTELMHVKNMRNFQTTVQKTFREYNKEQILSASEKKDKNNRTSSTPKKMNYVSPRKANIKDLELDKIGSDKMREHASVLSNRSIDKCRREINMNELSEDATNSIHNIEYKALSSKKNYNSFDREQSSHLNLLDPTNQPTYESPEPSKSMSSNPSSLHKSLMVREVVEQISNNETPFEDENIETVKLDSSRLRSQKRGLPIDEKKQSYDKEEETPKCTTTQKRITRNTENCYTGEKYILGDCFTDEKNYEMRLRNAVTSAKKINPLQIMKNLKSPGTSSYISSAKKALMQEQFDEDDKIEFQMSEEREYQPREIIGKENDRNNQNILIERFNEDDSKVDALKDFVNANKFQVMEQDYNMLESPEKSHQKHSKSRSRTKEKRGNRSEGEPENYVICPAEGFDEFEDNTCMMIDFNKSPDQRKQKPDDELEETSKSLEWILAKNIDKKKRDEICRIIGEEESRNTPQDEQLGTDSYERSMQEIEVEEIKRVKFGNSMLRNENIGHETKDENGDSNLGQYIECLESVESSAHKSIKANAEIEMLRDKDSTTEYMTDEILSMMLFNDIHD